MECADSPDAADDDCADECPSEKPSLVVEVPAWEMQSSRKLQVLTMAAALPVLRGAAEPLAPSDFLIFT